MANSYDGMIVQQALFCKKGRGFLYCIHQAQSFQRRSVRKCPGQAGGQTTVEHDKNAAIIFIADQAAKSLLQFQARQHVLIAIAAKGIAARAVQNGGQRR